MSETTANHLRPLGSTGLACHPLGFGCYRVMEGNAQHEAALRDYLERGGNLIDTSANYGDGPPTSGPSFHLLSSTSPTVSSDDHFWVFHKGNLSASSSLLTCLSRCPPTIFANSLPQPTQGCRLPPRGKRSVTRLSPCLKYYEVVRRLARHRFPFRKRL